MKKHTREKARQTVYLFSVLLISGTNGPLAARLAIARAQAQLAKEVGIYLTIRKFSVINTVGASALEGSFDCNRFADAHSFDAHFDAASFVGLAWRPANESICAEIYSTGRANLPGSTKMRDLLDSWSRMLPELLRFSTVKHVCDIIPERLKAVHRAREVEASEVSRNAMHKKQKKEETETRKIQPTESAMDAPAQTSEEMEDAILASLGLSL